ncbi:MAG: sugar ABC transporter permease, partial [Anaerolineae bacterium]|nr:sugar ABC transporter permease [Anaerolineae bacterium]
IWHFLEPALFIAPAFIVLIAILLYPLGYALWLSFHDWTLRTFRSGIPYVGFDNYTTLLQSEEFINSLLITLTFMLGAITLEFILGMGLALLLDTDVKGKRFHRAMILLPMMCTNVVIGLTWRLLYNYEYGVINYFLNLVGLESIAWVSDPATVMIAVIIVDVWNTTSFVALLLLAGLQSMPEEPFEAARIDGASAWQRFRYLTLPLLRPTITVVLLWRVIDTFRIFDVIYLLTAGGPARLTETVSIYVYRYGFKTFDLGFASSAAFIMILIMLVIAFFLARLIGRSNSNAYLETALWVNQRKSKKPFSGSSPSSWYSFRYSRSFTCFSCRSNRQNSLMRRKCGYLPLRWKTTRPSLRAAISFAICSIVW